jgi:hypothetical protein
MNDSYTPGQLVHVRNRDWIVLPSGSDDRLMIKPLGGSEDEITAKPPLGLKRHCKGDPFPKPGLQRSNRNSALLMTRRGFNQKRLKASALSKLAFSQGHHVPLIMALKLKPIGSL